MSQTAPETPALVALVGNPNVGKTTLFNALTGSNQHVGNYAGVTVAVKSGESYTPHGKKIRLLDLPGCYALRAASPDEQVAIDALNGNLPGEPKPDLVVCVVDSSALERQLPFVLQVLELGLPCVLALNMVDVAEKSGLRLDPVKLSEELGIPVVPMQANAGKGIVELKQTFRFPRPAIAETPWIDAEDLDASRRAFVDRTCQLAARRPDAHQQTISDRIDRVLLHPFFGWVFFIGVLLAVFWMIFRFAETPMGWIESSQGALQDWVKSKMADTDLRSLLVDGVIGGVGGVVVFLPQIILLFLFIGLLESSGYMARAAYLMDGIMSKAGLSGKSFLPLFSSYACAIPGVMATRTITSPKERLVTMFVAPWMSCSARLPVYFLIIPLLLHEKEGNTWEQVFVLFSLYALGTVTAFIVAKLLRGKLGEDTVPNHFLLELPPYRGPQWSYIFRHVFDRAWAFVAKAGTLILGLSILLWALQTYPKLNSDDESANLRHTAMGRIGDFIEPAVKPLGFDGRIGTAVLASFAAREVFNSTMAQLFGVDEEAGDEEEVRSTLRNRISEAKWPDGRPLFTPLTLISLLVFYVYALQCLPTSAVVAREAGSVKWAVGQFIFMMIFAYGASLLVFQAGKLMGFS